MEITYEKLATYQNIRVVVYRCPFKYNHTLTPITNCISASCQITECLKLFKSIHGFHPAFNNAESLLILIHLMKAISCLVQKFIMENLKQ